MCVLPDYKASLPAFPTGLISQPNSIATYDVSKHSASPPLEKKNMQLHAGDLFLLQNGRDACMCSLAGNAMWRRSSRGRADLNSGWLKLEYSVFQLRELWNTPLLTLQF